MDNNTAVVILNWNGKDLLEKYLPDVIKHSTNANIYVIDNASTDESKALITEKFTSVNWVQNKNNLGFAEGYNSGLKEINEEFILLLNSDVRVTENYLTPLIKLLQSDQQIAACQPKILSDQTNSQFEHAGASGGFIDKNYYPFCRGRIFNDVEQDNRQYNNSREVFWASGACLLIRNKLFKSNGGFDSDFFAHMEEIDLCWRIKKQNFKIFVEPKSIVYHLGGGTLNYNSPRKIYLNFRNNLTMIAKNHDGLLFPKVIWRLALDGIAGVKFLLSGNLKGLFAILRAHFSFYTHLGQTLKKRKEIKLKSTTFNAKGLFKGNILWSYFIKGNKTFDSLNTRKMS